MKIKNTKQFFVMMLVGVCLSISASATQAQIGDPPGGTVGIPARYSGSIYATSVSITETNGKHVITVGSNSQLTMHLAGDSGDVVRSCVMAEDLGFGLLSPVLPDDVSAAFKSSPQTAVSTVDYFDTFSLTFSGLSPGNYLVGLSLRVEPDGSSNDVRVASAMLAFTIN